MKEIFTEATKEHPKAEQKVKTIDLFEKLKSKPHPGIVEVKNISTRSG